MTPEKSELKSLLERLRELAPKDNARLQATLDALQTAVESEEEDRAALENLLKEFEEAYEKLTAPANRLGLFLGWVKDSSFAHVALGDTEYVSAVDPNLDLEALVPGTRVRLNEGYAIVGLAPEPTGGALFKITEVLEDGRIRIGGDGPSAESRFVFAGPALAKATLKKGDEVRLDPSGRFAIEHREREEAKDYLLEEVPEITWDRIGGQSEAIRLIRDTIELPLLHPEVYSAYGKKPIKGILLYGPPGCGKTLLGKATAYNLTQEYSKRVGRPVKDYFLSVSGPKILNMWLGESERMVREIFATARQKAGEGKLVFIFMDEAESLLRTRTNGRFMNISNTIVPQFCAELDGLASLENVVLMLTSNRPDMIDPAVLRPGRIDRKVKINRPDRAAAEAILGIYLEASLPIDPALLEANKGEAECARVDLIKAVMDRLWAESKDNEFLKVYLRSGKDLTLYKKDLVSGAILASVVDRAKDLAISRSLANRDEKHGLRVDDLLTALEQEFRESEIFPTGDGLEDWLQLIDQSPESVVRVRPVDRSGGPSKVRQTVS